MLPSQFFGGIALSVEQGHLIEEANLLISNIVGDVVLPRLVCAEGFGE